ncbi:MAG: hypothetical protein AAFQ82_14730 [Myxococcota bacterium]
MATAILVAHLASTLFMTGLIWFVQVVHYPLFANVGRADFARYEALHTVQTGWVVMPVMLLELGTALALVIAPPEPLGRWIPVLGLGLLGIVWLTTAVFSVPAHSALSGGFADAAHQSLVQTNWVRTVGWTLRSGLILWVVATLLRPA